MVVKSQITSDLCRDKSQEGQQRPCLLQTLHVLGLCQTSEEDVLVAPLHAEQPRGPEAQVGRRLRSPDSSRWVTLVPHGPQQF